MLMPRSRLLQDDDVDNNCKYLHYVLIMQKFGCITCLDVSLLIIYAVSNDRTDFDEVPIIDNK